MLVRKVIERDVKNCKYECPYCVRGGSDMPNAWFCEKNKELYEKVPEYGIMENCPFKERAGE